MSGSQVNPARYRVQAIDSDANEDQKGKKRRVQHLGREWEEAENRDIPVKPSVPASLTQTCPASAGGYADRKLLERAHRLFDQLTTLEERIAQLCFLVTDAIYDTQIQREVEMAIQTWQLGGILFQRGEYRRQAYLVERYQEISKTALLFANDYLHGLSFYLQGDSLPGHFFSEQHISDVGKAVMVQNRRLGVQIQFDRERGRVDIDEAQAKAFRSGIRRAHGIVGKEKATYHHGSHPINRLLPHFVSARMAPLSEREESGAFYSDYQVQETIGFKSLTFFEVPCLEKGRLEEALLVAFLQIYDVFLISQNHIEVIRLIARMIHSGKIREEILNRHVMKVLIIKSLYFG